MANLMQVLRNEEGIETLEWITIGVLIVVGIAVLVYAPGGSLGTAVANASTTVSNTLASLP